MEAPVVPRSEFADPIIAFWKRLRASIHPDDERVLSAEASPFELSYPPPAFISDIGRASIFILMANGGNSTQEALEQEFNRPNAIKEYIARLHEPRPSEPEFTAPYCRVGQLWEYLKSGRACVINAVAYRSREVTEEVRRFANVLSSVAEHRNWLRSFAIPAASRRRIAIVAKRPKLWKLARNEEHNGVFHDHEGTRHVSNESWTRANDWLADRK
jgi:hypothetical protein